MLFAIEAEAHDDLSQDDHNVWMHDCVLPLLSIGSCRANTHVILSAHASGITYPEGSEEHEDDVLAPSDGVS